MKKTLGLITVIFWILIVGVESHAAIYFVDLDAGNDSNNGTSTSTPWLNLPGTRNVGDTAYLNTQSIAAGDTIYIKAGTTHNSSKGGRILIDSTYYNNGTSGNYISIQVSDTWGSGNVTINGTGITVPTYWGLISIYSRSYITIQGTSTNRLVVQNSSQMGLQATGTSGTHTTGLKLRYMDFNTNSGYSGCDFAWSNNFEVRDCTASFNQYKGFSSGADNDESCDSGKYYDCISHDNGQAGGSGASLHGFGLYAGTNMEYWRCEAYNNGRDGFDFGTTSNTNNVSVKVVNCLSHNNGEDGFALNGGPSGQRTGYYINCISYNNGAGGFMFYSGGVTAYVYHCLAASNSSNLQAYDEDTGSNDVVVYLKNTLLYKNTSLYGNIRGYYSYHPLGTKFYMDYNMYNQLTAATFATIVENSVYYTFNYNGPSRPTGWNHEANAFLPNTSLDDDHSGWNQDPAFLNFTTHDFHPTSSSWSVGRGIYISDVVEAQTDKDGRPRSNPPTIGPYEYSSGRPNPPTALRIITP